MRRILPIFAIVFLLFTIVCAVPARANLAVHDIAVVSITLSPTEAYVGAIVVIAVDITNLGDFTETFDVSIYYDSVMIGYTTVSNLIPNDTQTLFFNWDTTGVSAGLYVIKAVADAVPGEIDIVNNTMVDGSVTLISPHDPVASFTESAHIASVFEYISFDPSGSFDPDGTIVLYEWDFDGDGVYDLSELMPDIVSMAWGAPGIYTVTLRVTDNDGNTDTATATKTITPTEVIPEVPIGTIMASATMIIALVAYVTLPRWRRKPT